MPAYPFLGSFLPFGQPVNDGVGEGEVGARLPGSDPNIPSGANREVKDRLKGILVESAEYLKELFKAKVQGTIIRQKLPRSPELFPPEEAGFGPAPQPSRIVTYALLGFGLLLIIGVLKDTRRRR